MTSRTPIRLTPHRGPLATPSTSPESGPTTSTPPTDLSYCSTSFRPTLDVTILQYRISPPSPPTSHPYGSRLQRRRRDGRCTPVSPLSLIFDTLMCSTSELAKTLAGIVAFCLFIWGLLEWSSCVSELPQRPSPWLSASRFSLPSHTRAPRCHVNPALCEARNQHGAVLQFLSEQIQHAKALSSISAGLGSPLRSFLEAYREVIPSVMVLDDSSELPLIQEVDTLANLTESLDPSLLDFSSGSFVGRSFTLALEELGDLISDPMALHDPFTHGDQDVHLHAIYWRTASNLLLEYSAARPRARKLLQHLRTLHQQLSPLVLSHHITGGVNGRLKSWWWKYILRHPAATEDAMQAFVTGLEVTLDNVHRLVAYLDWITEHLARSTLLDVLKTRRRTDFSSCMTSLQELFTRSKPLIPKKFCFCLNDYGMTSSNRPERVEIMVPGSPTVRAER